MDPLKVRRALMFEVKALSELVEAIPLLEEAEKIEAQRNLARLYQVLNVSLPPPRGQLSLPLKKAQEGLNEADDE